MFKNVLRIPIYCAVAGCPSPEGTSFHRFPKEKKLRRHWLLACKQKLKINIQLSRICGNHLLPSDFKRDLQNELLGLPTRKFLKAEAVPSQNLYPSQKLVSTVPTKRDERASKRQRKELVQSLLEQGK